MVCFLQFVKQAWEDQTKYKIENPQISINLIHLPRRSPDIMQSTWIIFYYVTDNGFELPSG